MANLTIRFACWFTCTPQPDGSPTNRTWNALSFGSLYGAVGSSGDERIAAGLDIMDRCANAAQALLFVAALTLSTSGSRFELHKARLDDPSSWSGIVGHEGLGYSPPRPCLPAALLSPGSHLCSPAPLPSLYSSWKKR